jgi:SAM-dependent methyltransferase
MTGFGYRKRNNWRDLVLAPFGWGNLVRRLQAPVIMKWLDLSGGDRVLDVGCGEGNFTLEIARRAKEAVGLDIAGHAAHASLQKECRNLLFLTYDGGVFPFPAASFDKILLSSVLQMTPEPGKLLAECRRVLKKDGVVVLSVPLGYNFLPKLYGFLGLDYDEGLNRIRRFFGARLKAYFDREELAALISGSGFATAAQAYSPGAASSFVYELAYLPLFMACPRLQTGLFLVFYPVCSVLEKFGSCSGNEIIIKLT